MKQVSKADFFGPIFANRLDVHPRITNDRWPYRTDWQFHRKPGAPLYGKAIGKTDGTNDYFLVTP